MKSKLSKLFQQFVKFGLVGVSNTVISLAVYYILVYFNVHPVIANAVGFVASVINSYFWNSRFVFKDKTEDNSKKAFLKVVISYGVSFLLSTVLIEV
ncbi:MAG: GtrA family protein, partial [Clostridia bacterium]|nr:GtrA family protein [Clostridia bacterium]